MWIDAIRELYRWSTGAAELEANAKIVFHYSDRLPVDSIVNHQTIRSATTSSTIPDESSTEMVG